MKYLFRFLAFLLGVGGLFAAFAMQRVDVQSFAWRTTNGQTEHLTYGTGIYPFLPFYEKWDSAEATGVWIFKDETALKFKTLDGFDLTLEVAVWWHRIPCQISPESLENESILAQRMESIFASRPLETWLNQGSILQDSYLKNFGSKGLKIDHAVVLDVFPTPSPLLQEKLHAGLKETLERILSDERALAAEVKKAETLRALAEHEENEIWNQKEAEWRAQQQSHLIQIETASQNVLRTKRSEIEAEIIKLQAQTELAEAMFASEVQTAESEVFSGDAGRYLQAILAVESFQLGPTNLESADPEALRRFGSIEAWRSFFLPPEN